MSNVVFCFARKVGDDLARIPIAYQYAKQFNVTVDICLEPESIGLVSLLEVESWVGRVFILPHPKESRLTTLNTMYTTVYDLDYFNFPFKTLTEGSINNVPINLDNLLTEPCLNLNWKNSDNLFICSESSRDYANENTLNTVRPIIGELKDIFKDVYFMGNQYSAQHYAEFGCKVFTDDYKMRKTLDLMSESITLTTYSSVSVLAWIQKYPTCILIPSQGMGLNHFDRRTSYYENFKIVNEHDTYTTLNCIKDLKVRL